MDIREKYYFITGDLEGAYGMSETDKEGFKYSENTLERALKTYEEMPSYSGKSFVRDQIESFGPRAGASFGAMYPMSPQSGMDKMEIQIQKATKAADPDEFKPIDLLKALGTGVYGASILTPTPKRIGALQGLLNYVMDR